MLSPDKISRVVNKASDCGWQAGFLCLIAAVCSSSLGANGGTLATYGYILAGIFLGLCIFLFIASTAVNSKLRDFKGRYDSVWIPSSNHIENLSELLMKSDEEIEQIIKNNLSWEGLNIPVKEIDVGAVRDRLNGELLGYGKIIQDFSEFEISWGYKVCQIFAIGVN
ncbi:hypothetical protein ACFL08_03890 [Patescibacteria group bacterium]